jgi:hypothetical protein
MDDSPSTLRTLVTAATIMRESLDIAECFNTWSRKIKLRLFELLTKICQLYQRVCVDKHRILAGR